MKLSSKIIIDLDKLKELMVDDANNKDLDKQSVIRDIIGTLRFLARTHCFTEEKKGYEKVLEHLMKNKELTELLTDNIEIGTRRLKND